MLGVITEKRVGDLPLPPETWIGAACNPAGQAAGGYELEPPMANRLYHHPWAMELPRPPDVILVATDGYTPWPKHPVKAKVVACFTTKNAAHRAPPWIEKVILQPEG